MQFVFGQNKTTTQTKLRYATEQEAKIAEINSDCIKHVIKPFNERLQNYPFNNSIKIQLVSFKSSFDTVQKQYYKDSLPRMNDTVCYSKLFEVKNLTYLQVDKLTDILYDYGYRKQMKSDDLIYIGSMLECYNPRNAILFIDSSGKTFEFIEICFECRKTERSSDKISLGEMCNQKLELIKNFFKEVGIEYGITEGL